MRFQNDEMTFSKSFKFELIINCLSIFKLSQIIWNFNSYITVSSCFGVFSTIVLGFLCYKMFINELSIRLEYLTSH